MPRLLRRHRGITPVAALYAGAAAPTVVFTQTLATANPNLANYTTRTVLLPSSGGLGQIRVRFKNHTNAGNFIADNVSVGIRTGTESATTAVPTELKFSTASGFTIASGASLLSDWLTFAYNNGDRLVIIIDHAASTTQAATSIAATTDSYYAAATNSYNVQTPAGLTTFAGSCYGVDQIETQA